MLKKVTVGYANTRVGSPIIANETYSRITDRIKNEFIRLMRSSISSIDSQSIRLNPESTGLSIRYGMLYDKSGTRLLFCPEMGTDGVHVSENETGDTKEVKRTVIVPKGTTAIGANAFAAFTYPLDVYVTDTVTEIADNSITGMVRYHPMDEYHTEVPKIGTKVTKEEMLERVISGSLNTDY